MQWKQKVCDECGSLVLLYHIKEWVVCERCGGLYSSKHKFDYGHS